MANYLLGADHGTDGAKVAPIDAEDEQLGCAFARLRRLRRLQETLCCEDA